MKLQHIKQEIADVSQEYHMEPSVHGIEPGEEVIYVHNKSPHNDVIEYNPAELSMEDSEVEGKFSHFY